MNYILVLCLCWTESCLQTCTVCAAEWFTYFFCSIYSFNKFCLYLVLGSENYCHVFVFLISSLTVKYPYWDFLVETFNWKFVTLAWFLQIFIFFCVFFSSEPFVKMYGLLNRQLNGIRIINTWVYFHKLLTCFLFCLRYYC